MGASRKAGWANPNKPSHAVLDERVHDGRQHRLTLGMTSGRSGPHHPQPRSAPEDRAYFRVYIAAVQECGTTVLYIALLTSEVIVWGYMSHHAAHHSQASTRAAVERLDWIGRPDAGYPKIKRVWQYRQNLNMAGSVTWTPPVGSQCIWAIHIERSGADSADSASWDEGVEQVRRVGLHCRRHHLQSCSVNSVRASP